MAAIPLKPQYGPTLGRLLEPRWRVAGPIARALVLALGALVLALLVVLVLSLLNASYTHSGRVAFSFEYRGLYRTAPNPGGYVKVTRDRDGALEDSYAVAPFALASYRGSVTGQLPLAATGYARTLAARFAGFRLEGEGKTRISSTLQGYEILYTARVGGRTMWGRDVLLLPKRAGAREGVAIQMLSREPASVSLPVASSGVLETPLKSFSFG